MGGRPKPVFCATNKSLAQTNKSHTRGKATKEAQKRYTGSAERHHHRLPAPQVPHHDLAVRMLPFEILGRLDGDGLSIAI
jgi:hypothetical protein